MKMATLHIIRGPILTRLIMVKAIVIIADTPHIQRVILKMGHPRKRVTTRAMGNLLIPTRVMVILLFIMMMAIEKSMAIKSILIPRVILILAMATRAMAIMTTRDM